MSDIFDNFSRARVLVVGDVMLDRYCAGTANRISPEAPIPVVRLSRTWTAPGGAGNVAACLSALGCRTTLLGIVGADAAANELRHALTAVGVAEVELFECPSGGTVVKTRILADRNQQIVRIDDEGDPGDWSSTAVRIGVAAAARIAEMDAVVIADYEKGTLPVAVVRQIIDNAVAAGRPVVVDPKKVDLSAYSGCTVITPNMLEAERAAGRSLRDDEDIVAFATEFRDRCSFGTMLVTRGARGMTGVDDKGVFHVPARVLEVGDVTGAGDTVVAILAAGLATGMNMRATCDLAALAAGIAVSHHGTYAVRADELKAAGSGGSAKLLSVSEAVRSIERLRTLGKSIAFTNGCFDLLHPGHLYSLQQARAQGDYLIVGLNSDASVRALKGPTRPIMSEGQRAVLLAGLACVDAVVIFDEETPEQLLLALRPDVLVKGGDYRAEDIVGADEIRRRGGRVVIVPRIDGFSTSGLVERMGTSDDK